MRKLAGGKRVENVEDVLGVGQKIQVEITKIDDRGKLSLAPVIDEPEAGATAAGETEGGDTEGSAAASDGPVGPAEG